MASLSPLSGVLGVKNAAHLLRRACFGATKAEIDAFALKTVDEAFAELSVVSDIPEKPIDLKTGSTWLNPKSNPEVNSEQYDLIKYFISWHLEQIRVSGNNLTERMVWFYHSHLPVQQSIVRQSEELYYQNALYRFFAFGNFKDLMVKTCIDNAMLRYIDNWLNRVDSPNENFARELMELYTIGKGPQIGPEDYTNYTEHDVKQAARVLSGFTLDTDFTSIDEDTQIPRGKVALSDDYAIYHDAEEKIFSEKFGESLIKPNEIVDGFATEEAVFDELNQFMDMIFAQEETSRFICRKIYRQFVYYKISDEVETDIIEPLAQTFRDNEFEILPVIEQLFKSQHFYDVNNTDTSLKVVGSLIKSPVELVMNTLKFFKIEFPTEFYSVYTGGIISSIKKQGLDLYEPIDVAGYPAYHQFPTYNRFWITSNNLPNRYKFAADLIQGRFPEIKLDVLEYVSDTANISNPADADVLLSELIDYLFPQEIPQERYNFFLNILLDTLDKTHWTSEWNDYVSSNDDTVVRPILENLFVSLLQTPEFQLM